MKKICWYVDLTDDYKGFIGVFDDIKDKEKIAKAIGDEIFNMSFCDTKEEAYEIGKSLAETTYAKYGDYEFAVESIKVLKL